MKYREILIKQLQHLSYFDKRAICQIGEQYHIKLNTIDAYIKQLLACKELIQLKKGTYVTATYFKEQKGDISYIFYLANILRQPSYVSSWTALQYYNLVTEAVYPIISVTPKVTRSYNNKAGRFIYQSIKKKLFAGFLLKQAKFDFVIASPAKALFDLMYFKTNQFKSIPSTKISMLLDDLRIDIDEMDKKELKIFYAMIKNFYNDK